VRAANGFDQENAASETSRSNAAPASQTIPMFTIAGIVVVATSVAAIKIRMLTPAR
jgi:hypothetical protein